MIVHLSFELFFDSLMFLETIAVAFNVDDLAVVQQAVQDSGGDHRIAEQLLPVAEAFVGGDDVGVFLVAVRDELEKQISLLAVHRQVPGVVSCISRLSALNKLFE